MIADELVPKIPIGLIEGKIAGYEYLFNPRGHQGVVVLFGDAANIFQSCKKILSFQEMKALQYGQSNPKQLEEIIIALGNLEMLDLGRSFSENLKKVRQRGKKKRMMVWLQLTDACNLRCDYCYIKKRSTRMGLELAKKIVTKVASDCGESGFDEVVFKLAGGEPTLFWKDCKELIDWAERSFANSTIRVAFHIITNGTLMSESLVEYLTLEKLRVSLSLDGVGKWHDSQRRYSNGEGSFCDVDDNINRLLSTGVHPFILTTVTKENTGGLTELARYCIERDLNFRFSFYRDVPASPEELKNDNRELINALLECYEWIAGNLPKKSLYEVHRFGDMNLKTPKKHICGIAKNGITLTHDGRVCICQYDMSNPLGSAVESNSIHLITEQKFYRPDENDIEHIPGCMNCEWRYTCGGGCPLLTRQHSGTFRHPSPYCEVYRAILPVLIELHALQLICDFKNVKATSSIE